MELTVNELSLTTTQYSAQAAILYNVFFGCCLAIEKKFKEKVGLFFTTRPQDHVFHHDLTFQSWLKGYTKDEKTSILLMLTKNPIILKYPYYQISEVEGMSLGYAHENDLFLISFCSEDRWKDLFLSVKKNWINDDGIIEDENVSIPNLSDQSSLTQHDKFISQKLDAIKAIATKGVKSGVEIWIKRESLFPNLEFCDNLQLFLTNLSGGKPLNNLMNRLIELEHYFATWEHGDFDIKAISGEVRLESTTRLNTLGADMTFMCVDGKYRTFSTHCDYGVWGFRMHLFPNSETRKCIIGYIGKKIGT